MKAYAVTNRLTNEYTEIVFAESSGKAKAFAMCLDGFEDDEFTEISARRKPELDQFFKGRSVMDWDDPDDRIAMVRYGGFVCDEEYVEFEDCKKCPAREWCSAAEEYLAEAQRQYEASVEFSLYCAQYEPSYNPDDGSM